MGYQVNYSRSTTGVEKEAYSKSRQEQIYHTVGPSNPFLYSVFMLTTLLRPIIDYGIASLVAGCFIRYTVGKIYPYVSKPLKKNGMNIQYIPTLLTFVSFAIPLCWWFPTFSLNMRIANKQCDENPYVEIRNFGCYSLKPQPETTRQHSSYTDDD